MLHEDDTVIAVEEGEGGVQQVAAAGKIGWNACDTIKQRLKAAAGDRWRGETILLDLAEVNFLDSAGISALLALRKEQMASGGDLMLCAPTPRIRQIFELVGMDGIIPVVDSIEQAQGVVPV